MHVSRRRFVALEAQALGHGGVSLMSEISGLARSTIYRGRSDIRDKVSALPGRIRKEGGGRKRKTIEDPTLVVDLKKSGFASHPRRPDARSVVDEPQLAQPCNGAGEEGAQCLSNRRWRPSARHAIPRNPVSISRGRALQRSGIDERQPSLGSGVIRTRSNTPASPGTQPRSIDGSLGPRRSFRRRR